MTHPRYRSRELTPEKIAHIKKRREAKKQADLKRSKNYGTGALYIQVTFSALMALLLFYGKMNANNTLEHTVYNISLIIMGAIIAVFTTLAILSKKHPKVIFIIGLVLSSLLLLSDLVSFSFLGIIKGILVIIMLSYAIKAANKIDKGKPLSQADILDDIKI